MSRVPSPDLPTRPTTPGPAGHRSRRCNRRQRSSNAPASTLCAEPAPRRGIGEVDLRVDQRLKVEMLSERRRKDQPGVRDQIVVIEDHCDHVKSARNSHLKGALLKALMARTRKPHPRCSAGTFRGRATFRLNIYTVDPGSAHKSSGTHPSNHTAHREWWTRYPSTLRRIARMICPRLIEKQGKASHRSTRS